MLHESPSPRVVLKSGPASCWLHFTNPSRVLSTRRMEDVLPIIREMEFLIEKEGSFGAGFISYEAAPAFDSCLPSSDDGAFPLVWFGIFERPDEWERLPDAPRANPPSLWRPSITQDEYLSGVRAIRERIRIGDTYQVNFTHRLYATGTEEPWDLFLQLADGADAPYAAFVDAGDWVACSASPELFFRLSGDEIESRPMKGTAARGLWFEDDERRAEALRTSEKERAENVMITDMVRNDLGRIAVPGTVSVPALCAVERYPTVWQMTSTVRARTSEPLDRILAGLFPPASITGAPKRRTMEIIAELEVTPRRIYTGAIGYVAPDRCAQFNVAIRTILIHKPSRRAEYGVGGGVVWDSDPAREMEECFLKAAVLKLEPRDFDLRETMLWTPGEGFTLLDYHMERLSRSAVYFGFGCDASRVESELSRLAEGLPRVPHRIRLLLDRSGSIRAEAAAADPVSEFTTEIPIAESPIERVDPFLYHKTTRRGAYESALRSRPGADDVLLWNDEGQVTESTIANVAFEIDGTLCTPPVRCGLLPGTYRAWLLDRGGLRERVVTIEEALRAGSVYLMNSVRGMKRVRILPREE